MDYTQIEKAIMYGTENDCNDYWEMENAIMMKHNITNGDE